MSELHPGSIENLPKPDSSAELNKPVENHETRNDQQNQEMASVESIRSDIEAHAAAADTYKLESQANQQPSQTYGSVQHDLKAQAYHRALNNIRQQLPLPLRPFSAIVHQPVVDVASNIAAKTIGRPVALLFASLTSLLSASVMIYTSKHYGFHYNYLLIVLAFGVGFVVGLVLETLYWLSARKAKL